MQGWLPISIKLGAFPAFLSDAVVRWLEFGSRRLTEPFFRHTVENLRMSSPNVPELDADITSIVWEGSRNRGARPCGFIFHMSRCGSTLVCNALKALTHVQIAAEASSITTLLMPFPLDTHLPLDHERENRERGALADCLIPQFICYRTGHPERTIVKFASQNSLFISVIRSLWPDVPCLFIVRNPTEVMVSNLKGGALNRFAENPAMARAMCGVGASAKLDDVSPEEFCGLVLGRYLQAATLEQSSRFSVIDYDNITPSVVCELTEFFNLEIQERPDCLNNIFNYYSKDPTGSLRFYDDRLSKRRVASAAVLAAAQTLTSTYYESLRARSPWK
jgi:hypothetical protein